MDYFSSASSSSSLPNVNGKTKKKSGKRGGNGNNSGVKLSTDPQSVAARERRHRISDRFKILQSLVPGGSKMDTVSMLEEAINYVKFLKTQIMLHQTIMNIMDDDHDSFNYLPPSHPACVSTAQQHQLNSFSDANYVGEIQPSVSLPFFQGEEAATCYDPFDTN